MLLADGHVVAYVDKGARSLLWWAGAELTGMVAEQLVRAVVEDSRLPQLQIERINGHALGADQVAGIAEALVAAGCYRSPKSLRVRAGGR